MQANAANTRAAVMLFLMVMRELQPVLSPLWRRLAVFRPHHSIVGNSRFRSALGLYRRVGRRSILQYAQKDLGRLLRTRGRNGHSTSGGLPFCDPVSRLAEM